MRYLKGNFGLGSATIPRACQNGIELHSPDAALFGEFCGGLNRATSTHPVTGAHMTVTLSAEDLDAEMYLAHFWARSLGYFAFLDKPRVSESEVCLQGTSCVLRFF